MPVRYAIHVELEHGAGNQPEHLHDLVGGWLDPGDRHAQNRKPWALGPLRQIEGSLWRFEVGVLDRETEGRLVEAVSPGPVISLGGVKGRVLGRAGGAVPEVVIAASWRELVEGATPPRSFGFEFLSPTALRSGPATIPLPLPNLVFGHFRSRWNIFAPEHLRPYAPLGDTVLVLSDVEVATGEKVRFKDATHVGFVGRAVIEATADSAAVYRSLDALASIAPFCGTGEGTAFGMGVTRYTRG
jgi:CRISPR-associated endoribonuclease Cas6